MKGYNISKNSYSVELVDEILKTHSIGSFLSMYFTYKYKKAMDEVMKKIDEWERQVSDEFVKNIMIAKNLSINQSLPARKGWDLTEFYEFLKFGKAMFIKLYCCCLKSNRKKF
jgi:hypothetical protein